MSVSHGKEVSPPVFTKMRQNQERVLINFVWVFWWVSSLCSECKLCNAVVKFLRCLSWLNSLIILRGWNFFRNWSSNVMRCIQSWVLSWFLSWNSSAVFWFQSSVPFLGMSASQMKALTFLSLPCRQKFPLDGFMEVFLLILLGCLMNSNGVILLQSSFHLAFGINGLTLRILTGGRWLPSTPVPLILLAHWNIISILRSFMRRQRSKVSLFIEFGVEFVFIWGIWLNTVLWLSNLVLSNKLWILHVCSLYGVKLLWLEGVALNISILIVSIQELLVYLRLLLCAVVWLLSSFDRWVGSWVALSVLPLHVHVLHLSTLLIGVYNLREVSLPSYLLCVQLGVSLILLILWWIF